MREEEGERVLGSYKKARVGTSMASACIVGAESTATRKSCTGGSERKGLTDGTHRSARANDRTNGWAGKRDPRDNERSCASAGEVSADKSAPLGSGRGRRARGQAGIDRRGLPVRGSRCVGARGAGPDGLAWAEMAFPFLGIFQLIFYFIFSRVFNSKSNQISNSN
jgi:hypothetical protein